MVLYVIIVAILNLALGYGLAVVLGRVPRPTTDAPFPSSELPLPTQAFEQEHRVPEPPATEEAPVIEAPVQEAPVQEAIMDEIPEEWLDMLEGSGDVNSFVEASIHILRLEVGRYRELLVQVDAQLRRCQRDPTQELLASALGKLKEANEEWLGKQEEAVQHLQSRQGLLGDFASVGASLEDVLLDQAAQIETTCSNIDLQNFNCESPADISRLLKEVSRLLDLCHRLRDVMHESMLAVLCHEDRLDSLSADRLTDALTGVNNRTGLQKMLQLWWQEDASGRRQASVAIVDVVQLGKINEMHGPLLGDRLIQQLCRVIGDTLRSNRGHDVISRFDGQRFVIFLSDTGPRNATSAIERIRQTIDAWDFLYKTTTLEVSVTCGVVEVEEKDTIATMFQRIMTMLRHAKRSGRNVTVLHTLEGPTVVVPPNYHVSGETVHLGDGEELAVVSE